MKKHLFILIVLFAFVPLCSHAGIYRYEWLSLGMSEAPGTVQRVRWRTAPEADSAAAQVVPAVPHPDFDGRAVTVKADSRIYDDYGKVMCYHHVAFDGLEPATDYLYRIGDGAGDWSEWYQFRTAGRQGEPFTFLYISDVQVGIHDHYPRVIRQAVNTVPGFAFTMFAGDLTGGASEWEWDQFFRANGWIFGMRPVAPLPDSHEYTKGRLTTYWDHLFSYPENTPELLARQGNYYFDYQDCRFIFINTKELLDGGEEFRSELLAWMERLMEENPHPWCIVGQHRPVYSMSYGRDNNRVYDYLKPLYDSNRVDLVLTGHDHVYSRTRSWDPVAQNHDGGPVYVVSVAGSQVYMPAFHTFSDRMASNTQLFQSVTVSPDALNFKAYLATGELYDEFEITRSGDSAKIFTDLTPDVPELTGLPTRTWQKYDQEQMKDINGRCERYIDSK